MWLKRDCLVNGGATANINQSWCVQHTVQQWVWPQSAAIQRSNQSHNRKEKESLGITSIKEPGEGGEYNYWY